MGATGYACRFYFYPLNYKIPEETYLWYFGTLERLEARVSSLAHQSPPLDNAPCIRVVCCWILPSDTIRKKGTAMLSDNPHLSTLPL